MNGGLENEEVIKFELAPTDKYSNGLPELWKDIMTSKNPVEETFSKLWLPFIDLLPETIKGLRHKLREIGLLETKEYPFSLIYVYEENGEPVFSRGYPVCSIDRDDAKLLPSDFLKLYKIHNGWTDLNGFMGFLPVEDWFDLNDYYDGEYSDILPGIRLKDFLIICESGSNEYLGFDLSKKPPVGLFCAVGDPVEVVPDVVRALDKWMAIEFDDLS